ncbi:MAG: hypothetical protein FWD88_00640 [Treponema sp.]|nr:hypothetical protein [Treponema sp.]
MGLLDKVDARDGRGSSGGTTSTEDIRALITDFCRNGGSLFHCIVFKHGGEREGLQRVIDDMTACHGAVSCDLSGKNCMVLLPGRLDMELFSHRISKSTGSTVAFQFSTDSPSIAFDTLRSYLP